MTALRAFEAVSRTGSVTAAARDLAVTHSAVSHQTRKLENDLSVGLLTRLGRRVTQRPAGEELGRGLASGFGTIAGAVRSAVQRQEPEEVVVSCTGTFLLHWLIPRLYRFKAVRP
ncbi:MAG: LysR family transcriptional regulator [Rhodospirillaceae bacterium]